MKGLELVRKSFRCEKTGRIPWVPFVGVHGAFLLGMGAEEYLRSAQNISRGVVKAANLYKADGIPVIFDLQLEAEVLGCRLAWKDDNPPSVISHPLAEGLTIKDLPEWTASSGRFPIVAEACREIRRQLPETALYGLVTGPFTLALHLLGTDIFLKMMMEPDAVHELMEYTGGIVEKTADLYIENGCDIIALVDPMTSQIDPGSFETFVSPAVSRIFKLIREKDRLSSFFVCGQAQQNIEVMCLTRPDNISIDENISLEWVKNTALSHHVSFGGNLQLTSRLLLGNENDCQRDALSCMDTGGNAGFVLAPGCDLPMETPVSNLVAVAEINHSDYLQQVTRELSVMEDNFKTRDLTARWKKDKLIIDVVTLDSSSCAPCQYMVEAMKQASEGLERVEITEFRIKTREGIEMMKSLGVQSIPTACFDGKAEFVSRIPSLTEIRERIEERLQTKV